MTEKMGRLFFTRQRTFGSQKRLGDYQLLKTVLRTQRKGISTLTTWQTSARLRRSSIFFLSSHLFLSSYRQPLIAFVPCFYTLSSIFITVLSLYQIWFYGRKERKKHLPRGPITPTTKDNYFMTIEYVCVSISVLLSVPVLFETISVEGVHKIRRAKYGILSLATIFLTNLPA